MKCPVELGFQSSAALSCRVSTKGYLQIYPHSSEMLHPHKACDYKDYFSQRSSVRSSKKLENSCDAQKESMGNTIGRS